MIIQIVEGKALQITRTEVTNDQSSTFTKTLNVNNNLVHRILIFPDTKDGHNQRAHMIHSLKAENA